MDTQYLISYVATARPSIEELYHRCVDIGMTASSGDQYGCEKYRIGLDKRHSDNISTALVEIEDADRGTLYLRSQSGMEVGVTVTDGSSRGKWWGSVRLSFQTTEIDWECEDSAVVDRRISELVDIVAALTPVIDPEYVWSAVYDENERYESVIPDGRPIAESVEDLSWITVLSEPVIEQFGGREHVMATPTWGTRALDSGHVLLVLRDHPYDPEETPDGSWKQHLLK